jgi:hypothetical protein
LQSEGAQRGWHRAVGRRESPKVQGIMNIKLLPTAVAAVVLTLSAFASNKAEAITVSSLTVSYSGLVGTVLDPGGVTGLNVGDTIAGTVTFEPEFDTYVETIDAGAAPPITPVTTTHTFAETGSFTFGKQGGTPITVTGATGGVDSSRTTNTIMGSADLNVHMANGADLVQFGQTGPFSSTPPLTSLAQLPTDSSGFGAFLGNGFLFPGFGRVMYQGADIEFLFSLPVLVTATPIPATLPLFGAALGALGFLAWKRRPGTTAFRTAA